MTNQPMTAKAKRAEQAAGVRYGCHVDLEPGMEPDGCVIDDEGRFGCIFAHRHRTREGCAHWRRVEAAP